MTTDNQPKPAPSTAEIPGESEAIEKVVDVSLKLLDRGARPVPRDQHPKHHGLVRAEFRVHPDRLPAECRVGLFAEPRTYQALIRFSNGGQKDDRKADAHGMAIKLVGVEGEKVLPGERDEPTHDFVLVDNPVFFLPDAIAYGVFSGALAKAKGKAPSALRAGLFFLPAKVRELVTLTLLFFLGRGFRGLGLLLKFVSKKIASPLGTRYWSTTPYRLGPRAVKYSAIPAEAESSRPPSPSADYLRDAMATRLKGRTASFTFAVQFRTDEVRMPIEDATVDWLESESPFIPVAEIVIPIQEFDTEPRRTFCENLSFTPWHALPQHEPLGGINRTRRDVYERLSAERHALNRVPRREPTLAEVETMENVPPPTTASMILDELELILKKRGHPPRAGCGVAGAPVPIPGDAEAQAKYQAALTAVAKAPDADAKLMAARVAMLDLHATGLALSGGGIRSGTFAVGFLQGLANQGLLGRFDYLSTVSGGGYAGGWLAAWLKREGDVRNVERQLDFSRIGQAGAEREWFDPDRDPRPVVDEEPQPLRHLRSFSSYLFPRPGLLSADLWSVIMIWIRNVSINMLLLFPLAMLAVLLGRLGVFFFDFLNADKFLGAGSLADNSPDAAWARGWAVAFLLAGGLSALVALMLNAECLPEFRIGPWRRPRRSRARAWGAVVGTVIAALGLTASSRWLLQNLFEQFSGMAARFSRPGIVGNVVSLVSNYPDLLQAPSFLLVMTAFGIFMSMGALLIGIREGKPEWAFVRAAFIAGASGGLLYVLVLGMVRAFARMNRPDLMATFAVPAALCVVIASTIVEVAIAGRDMAEGEREWWGRYAARLAIVAILWLAIMGSTLYLPGLFLVAGARARTAMASGWVLSTALGVLTGKFVLPRLQAGGAGKTLATLASFAPPIFLVGLGGAVGLLAAVLLNSPSPTAPNAADFPAFEYYLAGVRQTSGLLVAALMIGFLTLAAIGFVLIDVNAFSLNAMYANRLARCYLGASRPVSRWKRRWGETPRDMAEPVGAPSISRRSDIPTPPLRSPNPVTGFASDDDLPLIGLRISREPTTSPDAVSGERTYWGPHLLINTTMNLVAGQDLAWRSRKGESFLLSSLYCGAESVGYTKIPEGGAAARNLTLGRAIAVSGAAVDPNMRFYQSPALTALLAVFNARLGAWIQNPRAGGEWEARSPRFGGLLVAEMFGGTDDLGPYVHLSDGGHFENMGVYELIRRRCRYIVALDAGDEVNSSNSNLAILIRLCRIDFGVRIQIDTEALRPRGEERLTRAHVAIGRIRYDDVDQGQLPGVLVYVKTSMTGDEPPDLQNYARRDTNFPYQPTDLRQSFDEEQFECYRCLGDHVATEVFQDAVHGVRDREGASFVEYIPRLFSRLQARWGDCTAVPDAAFLESVRPWADLQRDLATEPSLARLSRQLYPEIAPAPPVVAGTPEPDYDRAEVHAVGRMLQIMEDTWLSLELRKTTDLPINRGWLNSFRRWASTPAFQALWPLLRPEFGSEFVRFCEDELHMIAAPTALLPIDPAATGDEKKFQDAAIARLIQEYTREWGSDPDAPRLDDLIERSKAISPRTPPAWLIVQQPSAQHGPDGKPIGLKYVLGIVLAAKFSDLARTFPGLTLDGEPHEFFVWMRRGFRATEMGAPMVREVLATKLGPALGLKPGVALPTLLARYPKAGEQGDVDHEREAWLTFLAQFDFRRVVPRKPGAWHSTLLRR